MTTLLTLKKQVRTKPVTLLKQQAVGVVEHLRASQVPPSLVCDGSQFVATFRSASACRVKLNAYKIY